MRKFGFVVMVMICTVLAVGFGLKPAAAKEPISIGAIVELTGEAAEMGIENQHTIEVPRR